MDGERIISGVEHAFLAWTQRMLRLIVRFYRPPRSLFGSFGYEAKHMAVLATIAWFLNKTFGPFGIAFWVAGSYLVDWILRKYALPPKQGQVTTGAGPSPSRQAG
jgi:hypothetical protein